MSILGNNALPLLGSLRHRARTGVLPWLVAAVLIAQAMIPLQSHTRLAVNDQGLVVEICTLEGVSQQVIDLGHPAPADTDFDPNPAMTFSQLMAEALLALDAVQPAWLSLRISENPPDEIGSPVGRPQRLTTIRGPPSLA